MVPPADPPQPAVSRVHAALSLSESHTLQVVEFRPGMTGVVETGRVMVDDPVNMLQGRRPEEAGTARAGGDVQRYTGDADLEADSGDDELAWFRRTFCNGAQECAQGHDWAVVTSSWQVGSGTGIFFVGSEGTVQATAQVYFWECSCTTPFCIGGPDCHWFENWKALVEPGYWISANTTGSSKYLQWNLSGAGGGTPVSIAAKY